MASSDEYQQRRFNDEFWVKVFPAPSAKTFTLTGQIGGYFEFDCLDSKGNKMYKYKTGEIKNK
ncbi:hypothetical protein CCP3SC1AL1_510015 [Gammaproteobacteria bacterium]